MPMDPPSRIRRMQAILREAYAHPDRRAVFYAASSGAVTGSERLNGLPCWDWSVMASNGPPSAGSTCLVPLALGCPPRRLADGREWVQPLIHEPAQVAELAIPDVWSGRTGQVLREIEQLHHELDPEVQIREPDIQSPLGIAELMWDESFYTAVIDHPQAVHVLLDKITTFQIAYVREIQRLAGERFNAAGFPPIWADARGTMVSDDSMTLLSPPMHAEFSVPYLNRFAEACGPLFYHSCSWRAKYFDNIRAIGPIRAVNWNPGNSDDPGAIIRAFSGEAVLAPHVCAGMHADEDLVAAGLHFADEVELVRYMLDAAGEDTCLMFWLSDVAAKGEVIERIYDLFDERGYSPAARGLC